MTIRSIAGALAPRHAKTAAMAAIAILLALNSAPCGGRCRARRHAVSGCGDCHSIEKNDVGPMHKGVVGRLAGSVAGYNYSPALKNSKIVWTEANLDKWLTGPDAMVPGTKMFYEVQDPRDRADIIAFLKEKAK